MDTPGACSAVYIVCAHLFAGADLQYCQRWPQERSTYSNRWPICGLLHSDMFVAHHATHFTFYQTNPTETNHTNTMDGPNICD